MEFYGFSLWHDLLTGSQPWLDSLGLGNADDFDPSTDGFTKVFDALHRVLDESGLRGKLGGCFHTSSNFPEIMERFDLLPAFLAARDAFAKEIPLEIGMHCSFNAQDLPLAGHYPEVLQRDFKLATKLGAVTVVAHFPALAEDTINRLVDELLSAPVIQTFRQFPKLTLCWENQGPKEYFGSLTHMLAFREQLIKRLQLAGAKDLIDRHLFCLDTGHLVYWANQNARGVEASFKEIETYLPKLARFLKVFHIHANDGAGDNHLVPHSEAFFDHKSRAGIKQDRFRANSKIVDGWLEVCYRNRRVPGLHVHVEALKMPFSLEQLALYGQNVAFFGIKPQVADLLHAMPLGEQIGAWEVAELLDMALEESIEAIARTLAKEPSLGTFFLIKDTLTFTREDTSSEESLRRRVAEAWNRLGSVFFQRGARAEALYCYEQAATLGRDDNERISQELRAAGILPKKVEI